MKKQVKRKVASKPRAIQTSRFLQMSHRSHSGRVLPRRNTSYPVLIMIVLCMGVFLAGWTKVVDAVDTSYNVSARVPGVAPTTPATIDLPLNGATFSSKPITVSGTCPSSTYVQLYRNTVASGIGLCDVSGHYSISTDLFVGVNTLMARVYSFSDTAGPDSSTINVTYTPPVVVPPTEPEQQPTSTPAPTNNSDDSEDVEPKTPEAIRSERESPIVLKTDYTYYGYNVGDKIKWEIDVSGGVSPYAVSIDWGDGTQDLKTHKEAGKLIIEHRYKKAGAYKGSFVINIKITDSLGNTSSLQLLAIVNNAVTGSGSTGVIKPLLPGTGITSDQLQRLVKYAWPTYGVVVLMLASFWLGEINELSILRSHHRKPTTRKYRK